MTEHVWRYSGTEEPESFFILPVLEDEIAPRCDITLRRHSTLDRAGKKVLQEALATYRSYDPLSFVMLLSFAKDGWPNEPAAQMCSNADQYLIRNLRTK